MILLVISLVVVVDEVVDEVVVENDAGFIAALAEEDDACRL